MSIRWLTRALARSAHFFCRLLSEFYDYPSAEIYSRRFNPFSTSSILRLDPPSFDTYTSTRAPFGDHEVSWGVPRSDTRAGYSKG